MSETWYRLENLLVAEHESGALRYEAHAPLGMQRCGACYVLGRTLVIGPWRREEHGYLVNEFLGRLERLPAWDKTDCVCRTSDLRHVGGGGAASEHHVRSLAASGPGRDGVQESSGGKAYRLAGHRVRVPPGRGEIVWETVREDGVSVTGPCRVASGVLFLLPATEEARGDGRREFAAALEGLPRWDRTPWWCRPARVPVAPRGRARYGWFGGLASIFARAAGAARGDREVAGRTAPRPGIPFAEARVLRRGGRTPMATPLARLRVPPGALRQRWDASVRALRGALGPRLARSRAAAVALVTRRRRSALAWCLAAISLAGILVGIAILAVEGEGWWRHAGRDGAHRRRH